MKKLSFLFIALLLNIPLFNQNGIAQADPNTFEVSCKVQQVYPSISITEKELSEAQTLIDLNRHYKPSWVKEYRSVEIKAINNGETFKVKSPDNNITPAQKAIMQKADFGTEISVVVHYIPKNNLQNNEAHFEDFSFTIDPNQNAQFAQGAEGLDQYLEDSVIKTTNHSVFKQYNLSSVKFSINEMGQVVNAHIVHSSEDEETDKVLLESICNMPQWIPAQYSDGTKVQQEYVLTVGDMSSCTMNLLNVRNLAVEEH